MKIFVTHFTEPDGTGEQHWKEKWLAQDFAKDQILGDNIDRVFNDEELEQAINNAVETHELREA